MKKYLFGLLAVVLAVGFSAFTKPAKVTGAKYLLRFNNVGFTQAQVQNKTNWTVVATYSGQEICNIFDTQEGACEIVVDETVLNAAKTQLTNNLSTAVQYQTSGRYMIPAQTGIVEDSFNKDLP